MYGLQSSVLGEKGLSRLKSEYLCFCTQIAYCLISVKQALT